MACKASHLNVVLLEWFCGLKFMPKFMAKFSAKATRLISGDVSKG